MRLNRKGINGHYLRKSRVNTHKNSRLFCYDRRTVEWLSWTIDCKALESVIGHIWTSCLCYYKAGIQYAIVVLADTPSSDPSVNFSCSFGLQDETKAQVRIYGVGSYSSKLSRYFISGSSRTYSRLFSKNTTDTWSSIGMKCMWPSMGSWWMEMAIRGCPGRITVAHL